MLSCTDAIGNLCSFIVITGNWICYCVCLGYVRTNMSLCVYTCVYVVSLRACMCCPDFSEQPQKADWERQEVVCSINVITVNSLYCRGGEKKDLYWPFINHNTKQGVFCRERGTGREGMRERGERGNGRENLVITQCGAFICSLLVCYFNIGIFL